MTTNQPTSFSIGTNTRGSDCLHTVVDQKIAQIGREASPSVIIHMRLERTRSALQPDAYHGHGHDRIPGQIAK